MQFNKYKRVWERERKSSFENSTRPGKARTDNANVTASVAVDVVVVVVVVGQLQKGHQNVNNNQ